MEDFQKLKELLKEASPTEVLVAQVLLIVRDHLRVKDLNLKEASVEDICEYAITH
jgi:hypothetical protein